MHRTRYRFLLLFGALALYAVSSPAAAHAGSLNLSGDPSPIPNWVFALTGGGVVVISFLFTSLVTDSELVHALRGPEYRLHGAFRQVPEWATTWIINGLGVGGLLLVLIVGLFGPAEPLANLGVLLVWVGWWAGYTMSTYLVGNTWPMVNPWRTIADYLPSLRRPYPESVGRWPSVVGLLALVFVEVVTPLADDPRLLALVVLGYSIVTLGGTVVYATCTFAPQENEGTLARFLSQHSDFSMLEPARITGFSPGRPEWLTPSQRVPHLERAIRLWPDKFPGEGHFIALMRRDGERSHQRRPASRESEALPQDQQSLFDQFVESTLQWRPPADQLALKGSYLYAIPPGCPDLGNLNVLRWGWWLGEMKKGRFEPSHALAMGLRADDARERLSLSRDDASTEAYLRGQVVKSPGRKGWVLVTVDGFPLGWGKRVRDRLKPHFPNWLRQF